jgi:uncharacterized protein YaaR (DUF327 family)
MKFKILLLLITPLLFLGCGSSKRAVVAKKEPLPSWYLTPAKTTSSDLYAVGEGQNREDAIGDALSMMLSTLSISLSSKYSSKSVVREGVTASNEATYTNEIQSEVAKVRISNYEVLNSKRIGYKRYIVSIGVNKERLFKSLEDDLKREFETIKERQKSLKSAHTLKKIKTYRNFTKEFSHIQNTLNVMSSLKKDFNAKEYIEKMGNIEKKLQNLLTKLSFSLSSNSSAKSLKATIKKALTKREFAISNIKTKEHFSLYITSSIQKATAYGFILAKSSIDISIKDYRGRVIGSNHLNITGQSTTDYTLAKENVAFKLNKMIEKSSLEKVLGL